MLKVTLKVPTFDDILTTNSANLTTFCRHNFSANTHFKGLCSKICRHFDISIHTRKEIQMKRLLANISKMDFTKQCKAKIAGKEIK